MIRKRFAAAAAALLMAVNMLSVGAFAEENSSSYTYADTDSQTYYAEPSEDIKASSSSAGDSSSQEQEAEDTPQLIDISGAQIAAIPDQEYTGSQIKPAVTVTLDGTELYEGTDFTVSYKNNVNEGTASVTVTGIGSYTGSVSASFKIIVSEQAAVKTFKSSGATTSSYKLSWSASSGADGYELYRYDAANADWVKLTTTAKRSYTVSGRLSATKDYYCIRAYRRVGSRTIYSAYTRLNTATLPAAVTNIRTGSVTQSGYTIKWTRTPRAEGYRVYTYNRTTQRYTYYKTVTTNSIKITGKAAGEKNSYKISAIIKVDGKVFEGAKTKKKFTTKPVKATGFKITSYGKGYISFKWDAVKNASKYQIYYCATKNGKYQLLREIPKNRTSLKTGYAPQGKKLYFKIRAVSIIDGDTQYGKCSSTVRGMSFNKLSINGVLSGYSNSRSVKQVNAQGYKLSDYNRNRLYSELTYLGGDAGYILYDIDTGSVVAYNANTYFGTASTVKMPYILYCLREMEDGSPSMNELLTYLPSDYNNGSSWLKTQPFYTQYSIKTVMELIGAYSDNCGYYMLQDRFGYDGYNRFISSLGCRISVSPSVRWGYVSAADSAREWNNMWSYFKTGRHAQFAKNLFATTCAANFRNQLGNRYTVYEKSGWTSALYNETALVNAKHPYIIICLSNRTSAQRMRNVAEISESIHNEMWNYYG